MNKKIGILLLVVMLTLSGCQAQANKDQTKNQTQNQTQNISNETYQRSEFVLGTIVSVKIFEDGSEAVLDEIFSRLEEIELRMSFNAAESEVKDVNAAAGKNPIKVSEDTFDVISASIEFAEISDGRFDPTIGPLVQLWGIGSENAKIPTDQERDIATQLIDWKQVDLDKYDKSIYLKNPDMELDLGAIAKGYASDEVVRILKENNVDRGIINLGGNVYAYGEKIDGSPWRIGIQNPLSDRGEYIGIVDLKNKSVVTSGIYERYFEEDGVRYHHLLDTSTGFPIKTDLASVTIITESSIRADALSTILFVAGVEDGITLLEQHFPETEAIFVTLDKHVYSTGLEDLEVEWTDDSFEVMP